MSSRRFKVGDLVCCWPSDDDRRSYQSTNNRIGNLGEIILTNTDAPTYYTIRFVRDSKPTLWYFLEEELTTVDPVEKDNLLALELLAS